MMKKLKGQKFLDRYHENKSSLASKHSNIKPSTLNHIDESIDSKSESNFSGSSSNDEFDRQKEDEDIQSRSGKITDRSSVQLKNISK